MELAALLISFTALGVAMIAAVQARRSADAAEESASSSREYTEIEKQRRTDEIEDRRRQQRASQRADVRVGVQPGTSPRTRVLMVTNDGPADAVSLRIEAGTLAGRLQHPDVLAMGILRTDEARSSVIYSGSMTDPPTYPAVVSWIDGAGEEQQRTVTLHVD